LDLHLPALEATAEEKAPVDNVLGPPDSGWSGGERLIQSEGHVSSGGHAARSKRHLLLPALHAIQARFGWINRGALNYACLRLNVPPAEAYGVASFYGLFSMTPTPPAVLHVCDDIACQTQGAQSLCHILEQNVGPAGTEHGQTTWHRSPCLGLCERAPAARLTVSGETPFEKVLAPVDKETLVTALSGQQSFAGPGQPNVHASVPQAGQAQLRLLRRVGKADPRDLRSYRAQGGYKALRRAFELGKEAVIREVVESNLLGRGGAAFPAGKKWESVNAIPLSVEPIRYVVCNADESEPGTFKDRVVMEADPFAVIEAITIAGFAVSARQGYLYIRGEYPLATETLEHAIRQARSAGLLGEDILGRGLHFDIELRRGAGAYICGEETALFNSIEGYRGEPRNKPPFPTQAGLFGKPTVVNNVETLVNILDIVFEGGGAYAAMGTRRSTGTKLFCLSGHVGRPGIYEVTFGTTLRELIELAGGVAGNGRLQAVLLGGAAGCFVSPEELNTPLTFEGTRTIGATLGSGVVMLFDDSIDLKKILLRIAEFFRDESCGQCVPCRIGTVRQEELLQRLSHGKALGSSTAEIALLKEIGQAMRDASICGLGQTASSAMESAVERWNLFGDVRDSSA
jgi:NADH-quinone oxidoreductase subunit F